MKAAHPPVESAVIRWSDRLQRSLETAGTPAVLGLDPNPDLLATPYRPDSHSPEQTEERLLGWCRHILDETEGLYGAVKLQSAWFELHGAAGMSAMERVAALCKERGMFVIADVKRADIGVTARAYAEAWVGGECPRADAATLVPWLGAESLRPWLEVCQQAATGAFVCVRTSNPAAGYIQDARVLNAEGEESVLWHRIARTIGRMEDETGRPDTFGFVVGANHPQVADAIRRDFPATWFLAPGLGAQGADYEGVSCFLDDAGSGALFPSSRAVTFPQSGSVRDAALRFIEQLHSAIRPH